MDIALVVVGGLVIVTFVGMIFDYLTKTRVATLTSDAGAVKGMAERIERLELRSKEQDAVIERLCNDVAFGNRLLEDRSGVGSEPSRQA
ncbi:MAG: hypothetical protein WCQ50_20940 [Spirochaetota bacterium]